MTRTITDDKATIEALQKKVHELQSRLFRTEQLRKEEATTYVDHLIKHTNEIDALKQQLAEYLAAGLSLALAKELKNKVEEHR